MENIFRSVFADKLITLLNIREESTVSAAKLSRISQKTIWNYCYSPTCNPTLNNVEAIADAFKISPYRFLLAESFQKNTVPSAVVDRILGNLTKLNEREIEHVVALVDLLASQHDDGE